MNSCAVYTGIDHFEDIYIPLRQKEGRLYANEEVARLPVVDAGHAYYKEWSMRKQSCKKLLNYIKRKGTVLKILEVGCGNGWLCAQLATIPNTEVTGLDINETELKQAEQVFTAMPNLKFIKGSLPGEFLRDEKFDLVVFAASIQYFPDLKQTIGAAIEQLTLQGEVHIVDSHFYQPRELANARQRTKDYFDSVGFTGMSGYYFHHAFTELENFQYKILQDPLDWKSRLFVNRNPFYWITIKNRYS